MLAKQNSGIHINEINRLAPAVELIQSKTILAVASGKSEIIDVAYPIRIPYPAPKGIIKLQYGIIPFIFKDRKQISSIGKSEFYRRSR